MSEYHCRCGATVEGRRLNRAWRRRGDRYICPKCWPQEPAERNAVWRYDVIDARIPQTFWQHQRAARVLWDGLCAISEQTWQQVATLRAQYAPAEAAAAERAREAAREAWEAVAARRKRLPRGQEACDARSKGDREPMLDALQEHARELSQIATRAFAEAKGVARAAGADETPLWRARDAQLAAAALWTYAATEDADGRHHIERSTAADAWHLARGLADQVIEEYRTAWGAWLRQQPRGRRMPSPNGAGLGDRVRWVVRYTNGASVAAMSSGRMESVHLQPVAGGRRGRTVVALRMSEETARLVVPIDRPLPAGPDAIRRVILAGQRFADRWQWSLQFTCREQMQWLQPPAERAEMVAIDLGWRMDDHWLQVAHCLTSDGQRLLVRVDRSARRKRAMHARAWLPSSWDDYLLGQQQVDLALEPFRLLRAGGLIRAMKAGTYPHVQARLEAWAEEYEHQRRMLARCRLRLLARRDQQYYEAAHWLCRHAKRIVFEGEDEDAPMDLRPLATSDGVAADQRHIVAPYRFRQIVTQVAARYRDTAVVVVDKNRTSTTCPDCGAVGKPGSRQWLTCPAGHRYHQDWGADKEMLRRERQRERETDGAARER